MTCNLISDCLKHLLTFADKDEWWDAIYYILCHIMKDKTVCHKKE